MKLILYIIIIYFLLDIFNSTPFKEHFEKTHYDVGESTPLSRVIVL